MIYYNEQKDLIGEFYWNVVPLIRLNENSEFIAFTYEWELIGVL